MMQPQALPASGNINLLNNRDAILLMAVGRSKDCVKLAQVEADINTLAAQLETAWPQPNADRNAGRREALREQLSDVRANLNSFSYEALTSRCAVAVVIPQFK